MANRSSGLILWYNVFDSEVKYLLMYSELVWCRPERCDRMNYCLRQLRSNEEVKGEKQPTELQIECGEDCVQK